MDGGVAAIAGLVLAAARFVAALTYQSSNILMTEVRQRFSRELARNWHAIIRSTLSAAVVSLTALLVDGPSPNIAMAVVLGALTLTLLRGLRAFWWLMYTLFLQHVEAGKPRKLTEAEVTKYARQVPSDV